MANAGISNATDDDNTVTAGGRVIYNHGDDTHLNPLTDGNYVVYLNTDNPDGVGNYFIYLDTGAAPILLSAIGNSGTYDTQTAQTYYQVNNKYVAYTVLGTTGQYEIWLRDSAGNNTQVTFFNSNSSIELLAPTGDIMFDNEATGHRYLAKKGILNPIDLGFISNFTQKVYYSDSTWYLAEGRYLYKLLVNAFVTVNDGNWNNPSTWRNGTAPSATDDVIVQNNVTVSSNETCNTLKVVSPGSVTVLTGFNLTVLH